MTTDIRLSEDTDWEREGGTAVRGSAFLNGTVLRTNELLGVVRNCTSRDGVLELLKDLTGYYSIIHRVEGTTVAGVDHIRSMPLFYLPDKGAIGDSTCTLLGDVTYQQLDPLLEAEYLLTSYVTGSDTLLPSVKQIEAGGWIAIHEESTEVETGQHTTYWPSNGSLGKAELKRAIDDAIDRLCIVANGRPIYVLLSGGIDSRIILCSLVEKEYQPLTALSFGRRNCNDVTTGRWVARSVGVDWQPVEYTADTWWRWFQSDEREGYYELTHNLDSLPGIAPCPAISTLDRRDLLPEDAIFVSGQTIASVGEHLPPNSIRTRRGLIDYILDNHYNLWRRDGEVSNRMRRRIDEQLPPTETRDDIVGAYEQWEWKERQGKFISQDGFSYSFWGYDWWFPLFDSEVMAVWSRLPEELRRNKDVLYDVSADYFSDVAITDDIDVTKTDRNATLVSKIMFSVYDSPLERVAWPLYTAYKRLTGIGDDDLAYHGMFGDGQPGRYYSGIETHHSYRVMHATGRMSFDPPSSPGVPADSTLRKAEVLGESEKNPRVGDSVY